MLTHVGANQEQIDKILSKHLKRVYHLSYSWDGEDHTGFVWCSSSFLTGDHYYASKLGVGILQWQVRNGKPMCFSFQKRTHSYNVSSPKGKLLERLTELSEKAQGRFWRGGEI